MGWLCGKLSELGEARRPARQSMEATAPESQDTSGAGAGKRQEASDKAACWPAGTAPPLHSASVGDVSNGVLYNYGQQS